jgi:hypothetical protein
MFTTFTGLGWWPAWNWLLLLLLLLLLLWW